MFYFPFIFFDLFFGTCQCRAQEGLRLFNQTQLLVFLTEGFSLLREQPFRKRLVRTVLIFTESSDQLSRATDRVPGLPASPGYVQ